MSERVAIVLSPAKSGTQSVRLSLQAAAPELRVLHAHTLHNAWRHLDAWTEVTEALQHGRPPSRQVKLNEWRRKIAKELELLRLLLDVRTEKILIAIRRDLHQRLHSELFHVYYHLGIADRYDEAADRLVDPEGLSTILAGALEELKAAAQTYDETVYHALGVGPDAVGRPFSVTGVRPDLEVAALDFARLDEHFAELLDHLGLAPAPLVHANPAHDRTQPRPAITAAPTERERAVYAAFQRDFPVL